jgi:peptide/nickel transport system permease protein
MRRYVAKRLFQLAPILFGITLVNFCLMSLAPSDAAERSLAEAGIGVQREALAARRAELGLDDSYALQYWRWLKGVAKGDLGRSLATGRPVWDMLSERLPYTLLLAGSSMLAVIAVSLPLGTLVAVRKDGWLDRLSRLVSYAGLSTPSFLVALGLIYVFGLRLRLLPVVGGSGLPRLALPCLTLSTALACRYVRLVRASVLEELGRDYVLGARSRGVKEASVLFKGVLRNALMPVVTLMGVSLGFLLGGSAVVEIIFMWPGMGSLAVEAIGARDYPVVQGYVVWMAGIFVAVNLAADLSYRLLNPRTRLTEEAA